MAPGTVQRPPARTRASENEELRNVPSRTMFSGHLSASQSRSSQTGQSGDRTWIQHARQTPQATINNWNNVKACLQLSQNIKACLQQNPDLLYLSVTGLTRLSWKRGR